jgi:LPS-assembly protein
MHKTLLILLFVTSIIFAKNSIKDENIQILAKELEIKGDIVYATGEVVVYSPNYYITANRLIYDKVKSKLELFDEVNIVKNNEIISYSQYIFIDVKKDINNFKPMLMVDNTNKIWFNAKNGYKNNDYIDLKSSTLSSCDCKNPAWSIGFSSGNMNTTDQWVNTYNTTLYIQDVPIFYTPYFGFPTDNTRRTGLLRPTLGYSRNEGYIYGQPIYYAPSSNYDFEYTPQIRNQRGHGHSLKYRYVDSKYSTLNMEAGIFSEKQKYYEENNLRNSEHYGWDLEYDRSKLFSNENTSDGLRVKYTDINDVDYLNTQFNSKSVTTDRFVESKFSYFYNTNNYYGDMQIDMYDDLLQENNDNVLQTIPKVNFHRYSDGFFNNLLTSSLNISSNRKTRKTGVGANTTDIYIPIGYHQYLANEFLNFSFTEEIKYSNIAYTNSDIYEDVNYGENNHLFSLYTNLIRPYDSFIHSMNLSATYTDSNKFQKSGDIYDVTDPTTSNLSPFAITQTTKNISLGLNQSFYNRDTLKEIVNHKMNQSYVYSDKTNSYEEYELQNDLVFRYDYGSLSNRLIYNYDIKDLTSSVTTLNFRKDEYFTNIYYTYSKNKDTLIEDKTLKYDLGFGFAKYYKLSYAQEYDLITNESKNKEYIFDIDEKCWGINFRLADSLVASSTTTTSNSYRQKIFYIELNLKQLFIFDQQYELKKSES